MRNVQLVYWTIVADDAPLHTQQRERFEYFGLILVFRFCLLLCVFLFCISANVTPAAYVNTKGYAYAHYVPDTSRKLTELTQSHPHTRLSLSHT